MDRKFLESAAGAWFDAGWTMDALVNTALDGKAILFKEIGKNEHVTHSEFKRLSGNVSPAEAVQLLAR